MQIFPLLLFFIVSLFSSLAWANDAFFNARTAFQKKDLPQFEKWQKEVKNPLLERYLESWYWRLTIEKNAHHPQLFAFLNRYPNSVVAEKFRQVWLEELVKQESWALILAEFPHIQNPTRENQCAFEKANIALGNRFFLENEDNLKKAWLNNLYPQFSCSALLEEIFNTGKISKKEAVHRARLQIEENKITAARKTLQFLSTPNIFWDDDINRALKEGLCFLAKLPSNWAENEDTRTLATFALVRYAQKDLTQALSQFLSLEAYFSSEEKAWLWGQFGLIAAKAHLGEALDYFQKAGDLTPNAQEWKARSALRAQNWKLLKETILQMPENLSQRSVWVYWLGRAYAAENETSLAQAQFKKIAQEFHYYANLAKEELGEALTLPPPPNIPPEELKKIQQNEDLQRALLLFEGDIRPEAVEEWNWAIRGLDDDQLLAAAFWAKEKGVWDRAINTSIQIKAKHHFHLRFLSPFKETIQMETQKQALDLAWVYGLMRQESRFITRATSAAGASGLMQLMPATAKWVAKKIGLKNYHPNRVNEHNVNVLLGTSYMRIILDDLNNSELLASAAYNAGPLRAKRWRGGVPMEGAIYAESIPFDETRDYVQKVLNNAVYYSILFTGKPDTLKRRLGTVHPQT